MRKGRDQMCFRGRVEGFPFHVDRARFPIEGNGNLLYGSGNSNRGSVSIQRGGMGQEMGGRFKREGFICIPMAGIHAKV